ncbi:hypothetical protein [Roseibium sp.]|uniref:hypothetical protein n=1 Tax=Roseibium sp. TaxID=1936156 RepID=UPI003D9C568C
MNVSEVARAAGSHVSQIFRRRKQLCTISDDRTATDQQSALGPDEIRTCSQPVFLT